MEKIRILIADDHDVVRLGISRIISEQPDMMVAAEAGDGVEALEKARLVSPDILEAIRSAHRGEYYLSPKIKASVIESYLENKKMDPALWDD